MSNNLRAEIRRTCQNERNIARREEINRRQNERNATRREELNRRLNERNATRQEELNRRQNERNATRREELNHRQNERNATRREELNHRQNERNATRREELNRRQNERNEARRALLKCGMHCIARNNNIIERSYLREMNHICQYCGAKRFLNETHFLCCHSGKVVLAPLSPYPPLMMDLMKAGIAPPSNHGPPCFRICGQIMHRIGNLRPDQNVSPSYCQLYVYDPNTALNFRMEQNDCCIRELMELLQTIISQQNPYALAFKNMAQVEDEEMRQAALVGRPTSVVKMSLLEGRDRRRYNLPSHDEVPIVFVGDDGAPPPSREVVIHPRGQALKKISSMSANLDPIIYPIFFPRGDAGWHDQLEHNPDRATRVRNHVTLSQYYNYRLSIMLETAEDIDSLISAEIPDQTVDPKLFEIVKTCMIHGPCGILNPNSSCMKDGVCTKGFPKDFNLYTVATCNGYPHYRRLDNGRVVVIKGNQVDNHWVVPYNPWLSKKYQAHINVEACMSIKSVKYLYKYIYKGHDCANVVINQSVHHDEVNTYLDCRFVSAPEALWRIYEYSISDMSHTIIRLQVHLPDNQIVYFNEGEEQVAINRAAQRDTHLTAWFKLNAENFEARRYSYIEIPHHFVVDGKNCKWKVRQRGSDMVIVRMYKVNLSSEVFFLKLLLLHVKGALSYENLRTVNGTVFNTFREACYQLGLLQDDIKWRNTLTEAVATGLPKQIRQLFSILSTLCQPDDPLHLWNTFKDYMVEDDIHRSMPILLAEQVALCQIESIINQSGKTLADYNLPTLDQFLDSIPENDDEDVQVFIDEANRVRPLLNDNQRNVADAILAALNEEPNNENKHSRLFFMDGPAGCGKTFTYNYLITETRIRHIRTATAAWTRIAATLLKNGCTLHGLFKLPVPILENSTCNVTPNSIHGEFLRQVSLFLLDEASMIPKHALSAIDKLLQDICNNNFPFGGKVILMDEDFRQILPVVKRGRPAEVVESCLKCSEHWQYVQRFSLTENMRVQIGEEEFSQWLLKLGSGTLPVKPEDPLRGCIKISGQCFVNDNEFIVEKIFGGTEEADYANCAILTPTNVDSLAINEEVVDRLPVEFLNSLTPSGMPVHCLKINIGAVVMLLRNLDLKGGLCNGTRLMVRALHNNYFDGQVLTGVAAGNRILVPRIQLALSDSNLPFILKRRKFPVRLAYSMTINKS
nr:uncharacterized protein LOC105849148 [Hydra vulgaris]